jgi:hypothetical protein
MEESIMAEADLNQILDYIQEREETLSRYSDKLRQSLIKIANIFGRKDLCRYCGWYVHEHPTHKTGTGEIFCQTPVPKIEVSIDIVDDKHFHEEVEDEYSPNTKYYLAIIEHRLGYVETYDNDRFTPKYLLDFNGASREQLKALVKSGRLIPFLQKVADTLQGKSEEYREVAEVAEKLAKAVSP